MPAEDSHDDTAVDALTRLCRAVARDVRLSELDRCLAYASLDPNLLNALEPRSEVYQAQGM